VEKYMQAMDVFLFPSLYEGLGLVAIEAQAAALKVIASDYIPKEANITNYFEHYPLDDKSVWVNRILELSNGYERKDMSDEIIDNGYDIKNVAKLVQDIYISEDNKLNK
jgi:glycosyltransferase involved in cell wall biosynthesis